MGIEGDQGALPKRIDQSVVLEMEALTSQVPLNTDYTASTKFNRSLSRKASDWWGKSSPKKESNDSSPLKGESGYLMSGGATVAVAVDTTSSAESRGIKRHTSHGRRHSPWIHPRRVLLFFATLSSMGTIILLYFTLSVTKFNGDDGNGFQA